MSLIDLCRLFHLTHKHILDTFLASTVLRLQYGCCFTVGHVCSPSPSSSSLSYHFPPTSLMFSTLSSSHLSLPPSLFLWLFIFPPCLSFSPFPPTSSPHSTLSCRPVLLFSSSTDFTSPEVHLPMAEEKDYFTVTDELSRENSHFALSEALLVVIEQVGWQ